MSNDTNSLSSTTTMSNDTNSLSRRISLKISLASELRRGSLSSVDDSSSQHEPKFSFLQLKAVVIKLFDHSLKHVNDIHIRYQDEESDWITISSDDELAEAITIFNNQHKTYLRLAVFPVVTPAPSSSVCEKASSPLTNPSNENLHQTLLNGMREEHPEIPVGTKLKPWLDNYCDMWSKQNSPLVKPTEELLQSQRSGLQKVSETKISSTLFLHYEWRDTWEAAKKKVSRKITRKS